MEKRKIIKIIIWAICIVVFICWMIVTGGELKDLKAIDENYEVSVTVIEKHLEGYTDDTVKQTVYEFTGEDSVHFRDILIKGIKARRLFGGELNVRDPKSNKRITIVANHKTDNGDFAMDIIYRDYLKAPEVTHGFLRNYHEELESEVLEFLSSYEPISDDLNTNGEKEIKYELSDGVYIITGYAAEHIEYTPANDELSMTGELLYYVNPYFLGDYFTDKITEGGASWADESKSCIRFNFTVDNGEEGGAVAGSTVSATLNLKDNYIIESSFTGFESQPFTNEELIEIGNKLADIIYDAENKTS